MNQVLAELPPPTREVLEAVIVERVRVATVPLELEIQRLRQMLRLELIAKDGAKSEKLTDGQLA